MKTTFTINELMVEQVKQGKSPLEIKIKDDAGEELFVWNMVPGYGGHGPINGNPTKFVTIQGRKALFVTSVALTVLQHLKLEWA